MKNVLSKHKKKSKDYQSSVRAQIELLMYESWLQFLLTFWYIKNLYKSDWCILEDLIEVI